MKKPDMKSSLLGSLKLDDVAPDTSGADDAYVERKAGPKTAKGDGAIFRTSVVVDRKVHDVLREIAFTERTSFNALVLEGLDAVLKKRMHPSVSEITGKK